MKTKSTLQTRLLQGLFFLPLIGTIACGSSTSSGTDGTVIENVRKGPDSTQSGNRLLRHAVFFAYQDTATTEQIASVERAFEALQDSVPGILAFEHGTNNSPEKLNRDLTHAYLLTFGSEADRDAYLPHPAHLRFGDKLRPILKDVMVVDYWTGPQE